MLSRLFVGCCILTFVMSVMAVEAAKVAIVDFADQWTDVDALRQTLDKFEVDYDDLTNALEGGQLHFKAEHKIFLIGSFTTDNAVLHQNLDENAQVIQDFVKNGGIVWEPTQADQSQANVDWLPPELRCVRGDDDREDFTILATDHPLFNEPNRMNDDMFKNWGYSGWPTVWEVITSQNGFDVLVESLGEPVIMEATYGKGKFLMMSIAPDIYHIVGNDDHTKNMAALFMENLLNYVEADSQLTTRLANLKKTLVVESIEANTIAFGPTASGLGVRGQVVSAVFPGQVFNLYATVSNQSTEESTTALLKFYRSTDENISTDTNDNELLEAILVQPLPADDTATKFIRTTAPKTPGTYYYGACVSDTDDEHCSVVVKITVQEFKPDLMVELVGSENFEDPDIEGNIYKQFQRTDEQDLQFKLDVEITNQGNAKSEATILQYYKSANDTLSESDTKIGEYTVPALEAGASFKKSVTVRFNPQTPYGPTYYGVYVKSVKNENKTENNWSEPAQLFIYGDTGLKIPEDLISQVAFGSGYTYFVLRSYFPKLITSAKYSIGDCIIKLDLPGVPSKPASKGDIEVWFPGYFMYPLETPEHRLGVAEEEERANRRKKIQVTAKTAGAIGLAAVAVASAPVAATASTLYTLKAYLAVAKGSVSLVYLIHSTTKGDDITTAEEILTATADPIIIFRPFQRKEKVNWWDAVLEILPDSLYDTSYVSDGAIDVLFLVRTDEMRQDRDLKITISQTYQYDFDEKNKHRSAEWTGIWNLEERWQQENPGTAAAPPAQLTSLADYPPFQRLPPEVQEYLLRHFNGSVNVNAEELQIPEKTSLLPNYPNPFNPETWIPYQLTEPADVQLTIYDIKGNIVRALDLGHQRAGIYQDKNRAAYWDGRNEIGEPVASGVYFYTLTAGEFTATRKMLIRK